MEILLGWIDTAITKIEHVPDVFCNFCFNSTNQCYQKWIYKPKLDKLGISHGFSACLFLWTWLVSPPWVPLFPGGAARLFVSALPALDAAAVEAARTHDSVDVSAKWCKHHNGYPVGDACCIPDVFVQFWTCKGFFLCKGGLCGLNFQHFLERPSGCTDSPACSHAEETERPKELRDVPRMAKGTTAQSGSRRTWRPNSAEISRCANRMRDVCVQRPKKRFIPWAWNRSTWGILEMGMEQTPPHLQNWIEYDRINMGGQWFGLVLMPWCTGAMLALQWDEPRSFTIHRAKRCKNG